MTSIRRAEQKDIPWLLEQLRAFAAFFGSAQSLFPADSAVAKAILAPLVGTQPFFIAEDKDGMRVGFIAGALQSHPFNPAVRILTELFLWVSPGFRGARVCARLMDYFEGFGRANDADMIVMSRLANSPIKASSYERRGYRLHEESYLLECNPVLPTSARSTADRQLQEV